MATIIFQIDFTRLPKMGGSSINVPVPTDHPPFVLNGNPQSAEYQVPSPREETGSGGWPTVCTVRGHGDSWRRSPRNTEIHPAKPHHFLRSRFASGNVAAMPVSPRILALCVALFSMACVRSEPAGPGVDQKAAEAKATDKPKPSADKVALAASTDPGGCYCEHGRVAAPCNAGYTANCLLNYGDLVSRTCECLPAGPPPPGSRACSCNGPSVQDDNCGSDGSAWCDPSGTCQCLPKPPPPPPPPKPCGSWQGTAPFCGAHCNCGPDEFCETSPWGDGATCFTGQKTRCCPAGNPNPGTCGGRASGLNCIVTSDNCNPGYRALSSHFLDGCDCYCSPNGSSTVSCYDEKKALDACGTGGWEEGESGCKAGVKAYCALYPDKCC